MEAGSDGKCTFLHTLRIAPLFSKCGGVGEGAAPPFAKNWPKIRTCSFLHAFDVISCLTTLEFPCSRPLQSNAFIYGMRKLSRTPKCCNFQTTRCLSVSANAVIFVLHDFPESLKQHSFLFVAFPKLQMLSVTTFAIFQKPHMLCFPVFVAFQELEMLQGGQRTRGQRTSEPQDQRTKGPPKKKNPNLKSPPVRLGKTAQTLPLTHELQCKNEQHHHKPSESFKSPRNLRTYTSAEAYTKKKRIHGSRAFM